jgi:hypothetical protein
MRRAALAANSAALVARTDQWALAHVRMLHSPKPPLRASSANSNDAAHSETLSAEQTAVTTFLRGARAETRYRRALELLASAAGCIQGYLYRCQAGTLQLWASLDDEEPGAELEERIAELMAVGPAVGQYEVELPSLPEAQRSAPSSQAADAPRRFRLAVLGAPDSNEGVLVAALLATDGALVPVGRELLAEIAAVLGSSVAAR